MLTLNDGRNELWQWDTGRKLTVDAECSQVHFSNKVFGRSIDVDVVDGVAIIPDILLQTDKELTALAFVGTAENGYTKISKTFKVNRRNKPSDYVFTPTDQTTLEDILNRIEDLEKRPSGDVSEEDIQNAVNDYLEKNPVSIDEKDPTVPAWAKQLQKPKYTAAEVGALPSNTFIPKNASDVGAIPVPETATVGQTIVVKEVDEDGKPVSWECVDVARGGGEEVHWDYEKTITIEEEVASITIDAFDDGTPLAFKKVELSAIVDTTENSIRRFKIVPDLYYNANAGYIDVSSGLTAINSGKATLCQVEGDIVDGVIKYKAGITSPTRYFNYYAQPLTMEEKTVGLSFGTDFTPFPNKATCFNKIDVTTETGNFTVGSTITIKGVRA